MPTDGVNDTARAAELIHRTLPVVDGHNDLPWALRMNGMVDASPSALRGPFPDLHTDIARLYAGGVGAQFWSVFVPAWSDAPLRETIEQIDLVKRLVAANPEDLEMAYTATDVERIRSNGRIASLLGAEGGHSIEESLGALRMLYELGVRYLTLTHADNVPWADSATDEPEHGGLTEFGRDVVREMNRIGMLVDISHVSPDTMRDALEVSSAPVMASHSSAFQLARHPRNIPDDVLRDVASGGGVVMVNFYPGFVIEEAAAMTLQMFQEDRRLRAEFDDDVAFREASKRARAANPLPRGSVDDVVAHIEHIAEVAGIDHVGLGSDFDGVGTLPEGLEDVSTYPAITRELLAMGWSEPDIRKVLGDNAIRVLAAAEEAADNG